MNLYDNRISKMEGFQDLVNLKKLYLEKNLISRLEGLQNCRVLEELHLNNQLMAEQTFFTFDEYSLAAISKSIRILMLQNCKVKDSKSLYYLENLDQLNLKDNLISNFDENVCPLLQTMSCLRNLWLTNNPVTQISKYRD